MIPVLTAADVSEHDAAAVQLGIGIDTLMEHAGFAVARAARAMLGGMYGKRIVIVCGKGNNAGDGLVAGRLLTAQGAACTAVLTFAPDQMSSLARAQLVRFPGRCVDVDRMHSELDRCDLVIDAIFGVGLTRAPEGDAARAIAALHERPTPRRLRILAVDVPSGLASDTGLVWNADGEGVDAGSGAVAGGVVHAERTVTFGGLKPGLLFDNGKQVSGAVEVANLGVFEAGYSIRAPESSDVKILLESRARVSSKRDRGAVLVVAGSRPMPGAAVLAAAAAVHGGAGLTTVCAPESVCAIVASRVPEVTTIPVPETDDGSIDAKALDVLVPRLDHFDAMAIGPGLGTHPSTVEFVHELVARAPRMPIVVDADGLNAFRDAADALAERGGCVLTPHTRELARLMGQSGSALEADRLASARAAAERFRAVVVFKGAGTVVAEPASAGLPGQIFVNPTGDAGLAQGGSGDVLTGLVAAFLAFFRGGKGSASIRAVVPAVWLHGRAAERIAARIAPHTANATLLIDEIGPTMHEVCA